MALQVQGATATVLEVESATRAARVTPRPTDVLGSYAMSVMTGTMAAGLAAGAPVFSCRWINSPSVALIRKVSISMASLGTAFTAGVGIIDMIAARAFSVVDSGGTSVLPSSNSQKKKTAFAVSAMNDLRLSSTAALTAGTRTLDAQALAGQMFTVSVAASTVMLPLTPLWAPDWSGEWPLVLAQNEGFILRATVPATGTWQMRVDMEWSEVSSF